MKKYIQTKNLPNVFDLSTDYFSARMGKEFIQGVHFFIPPNSSKTKKAVLWSIKALEDWLRGNQNPDSELQELLNRT